MLAVLNSQRKAFTSNPSSFISKNQSKALYTILITKPLSPRLFSSHEITGIPRTSDILEQ